MPCVASIALISIGFLGMWSFPVGNGTNDYLLMENIEALSQASDVQDPCNNNSNGYRQWSTGGFLRSEKQFYDCCSVLRTGYNPQHSCR